MKGSEKLDRPTLLIHPLAVTLLVMSYYASGNWIGSVSGILAGFFFSALICHLALSRRRPSAERLTEFYLYVSLGGVLGGAFAALLAPVIFNNVYEYPLALAAACLFRPRGDSDTPRLRDASFAGALMMVATALLLVLRQAPLTAVLVTAALGAAAAMIAGGWGDEKRPAPLRYGFLVLAAIHATLVIWTAFNVEAVFAQEVVNQKLEITVRQPWFSMLIVTSMLILAFCVHGTLQRRKPGDGAVVDYAMGAAIPAIVLLIMQVLLAERLNQQTLTVIGIGFCAVAVFLNRGKPIVMALSVLAAFAIIFADDARGGRIITQERSFFGVLRTRVMGGDTQPPLRVLMHGTTIHGAQLATPELSRLALTYYNPRTALGEAIVAGLSAHENASLALIGLGAGSTACLMRPEDRLTIFEIDPAVVRLSAQPGGDFTYVPECQPNARVELGDARLQIAEEDDRSYDVIVVDAFSSDAIPAHLLTAEALRLYLSKATENGIVVLHLSNRNLALVSEAARVARDIGAPALYRVSERFEQPYVSYYGGLAASVMIVARTPETLARLPLTSTDWRVLEAPAGRGWTDDYINMPRALWEGLSGMEECRLYSYLPRCRPDGETDAPAAPDGPEPPVKANKVED